MPAHDTQSYYYSGQGVVMIAERDPTTGEPQGFIPIGNVPALTIAIATTNLEHKESTTGARGVDLRLTQEINATVSMTLESVIADNLALGLYGSQAAVTAATSVAVALEGIKLGMIYDLGHLKIDDQTFSAVEGATPLVEGENYRLNAEAGSIYFMTAAEQTAASAANPIADDADIDITLDHEAYVQLEGLTEGRPERWLRFEGLNTARGNEPVVVDIFRFATDPLQELALINEELGQITVEGSALADLTRTTGSKYFRQRLLR